MSAAIKEIDMAEDIRLKVLALVPELEGNEKAVAKLRFSDPALTLSQVSNELGISRIEVRLIETRLMKRVRNG